MQYRSTFLVRVFPLLFPLIVHSHRIGTHARQEYGTILLFPFLITGGEGLSRVCVINFDTGKLYTINTSSHRARSPTIAPGKLAGYLSFSDLTLFSE